MAGQPTEALAVMFRRRRFGSRDREQRSAERQFLGAVAIGEEADVNGCDWTWAAEELVCFWCVTTAPARVGARLEGDEPEKYNSRP